MSNLYVIYHTKCGDHDVQVKQAQRGLHRKPLVVGEIYKAEIYIHFDREYYKISDCGWYIKKEFCTVVDSASVDTDEVIKKAKRAAVIAKIKSLDNRFKTNQDAKKIGKDNSTLNNLNEWAIISSGTSTITVNDTYFEAIRSFLGGQ